MLARAKPIAAERIKLNFTMIKRSFRRTVAKYRGSEAARRMGFGSLNQAINLIWDATARPLGQSMMGAIAVRGPRGIVVDSNKRITLEYLVDVLLHEVLHYWATVKKRYLGSCLDHLCLQDLGETIQPDATPEIARRRYAKSD